MLSKIKSVFAKNRLAVSLLIVFLIFLVALFFLLSQSTPVGEVIEKEKPEEVADTEISAQAPVYDPVFIEKAIPLNTSEKLLAYLNEHYLDRSVKDVSFFGAKALNYHNYVAVIVKYETIDGFVNAATVFRDGDTPKHITVTDEGIMMFAHGRSFEDLLNAEEKRLNTEIVRFTILYEPSDVFKVPEWKER